MEGPQSLKSMQEFVQSESLCDPHLFVRYDDGKCASNDVNHDVNEQLLVENSARVALLITRSFDNFCRLSSNSHRDVQHYLSSIELDNFVIKLDHENPDTKEEQEQSSMRQQQKSAIADRNGKLLELGYFSSRVSLEDDVTSRHPEDPPSRSEQQPGYFNGFARESPDVPIGSQSGGQRKWTRFGVEIQFPTRISDQLHHSNSTPMQILGKLLHSIFSRGGKLSSDLLLIVAQCADYDVPGLCSDEDASCYGRSSKNLRGTQVTVFSQLVDCSTFPLSVCRLISDLIDTGPAGKADSPFTSFDDVIQDLEQMISQPLLFLHDSHLTPSATSNLPMFGKAYYGREEECARIIRIALQMKDPSHAGVEAIFVSGIAGSGKSQLVQTNSDYLSNLGWNCIKSKFERGAEHASRGIISSMFDEVVSYLVKIKEGGAPSDVTYSHHAAKSIIDNIGRDGLSLLVDFLPSLHLLFNDINTNGRGKIEDWQLISSLTKILDAVLDSSHLFMLCCDDLQWADRTSLALISEVLTELGRTKNASCHCLFIGLYREDEVDDDHPFSIQYSYLQKSSFVNTIEVNISNLTKKDVFDMTSSELRLPLRLVRELADIVYKKTSGHAFFIVELLNSLLRDSIIAYSTQKCRYDWDKDRLDSLQTAESVAELIGSNLSSLPLISQEYLRILSMFGTQTDIPLLQILEQFEAGIICSIDTFTELGILERAGPIIIFAHDLIHQRAYEGMPLAQRQVLHVEIGQFLGEQADVTSPTNSVIRGMEQRVPNVHTFYAGQSLTSSLISIACDQLNAAGPDAVSNDCQRLDFAGWNLCAGRQTSAQSDFRAALFYFSKGIAFLGNECWLNDQQHCLALHEGAVFASFALAELDNAIRYAEEVVKHVSFEESLAVIQVLLKSLGQLGRHEECVTRGVAILCRLDFSFPLSPTDEMVKNALSITDSIASNYTIDQIVLMCDKVVDDSVQRVVKLVSAMYVSCYILTSPFLPVAVCEMVKYSLKHGVCLESRVAFSSLAKYMIVFEEDYASGKRMAQVVRAITKKYQDANKSKLLHIEISDIILCTTIDIWFTAPKEIAKKLLAYYHQAMKMGQSELSMFALRTSWRFSLLGGENLAIISQHFEDRYKMMEGRSKHDARNVASDNDLLMELIGRNGSVLRTEKGLTVQNDIMFHMNQVFNVLIEYWRGNYLAAEKASRAAWSMSHASKMPTIYLIYHVFFCGLIAFRLFREFGMVDGDKRLDEGIEMLEKVGKWAKHSELVFGSKWLLLKAEHAASVKHGDAKKLYEDSIKMAGDYGNIHELALAHELVGNYYSEIECRADAIACFHKAYEFYNQWGATAVADKILLKHKLDLDIEDKTALQDKSQKHPR